MKKFLIIVAIIFATTQAHQFNIYSMNGRFLGSINGTLDKFMILEFTKKYHSSILVKKGTSSKHVPQNNISLFHLNQPHKSIKASSDSLDNNFWIETEKNETVKFCLDRSILAWETSLNAKIYNDSCLIFQAPTLIGTDSIKIYFPEISKEKKINLAIGMKYLNLKNKEILLGFNVENKFTPADIQPRNEDPERIVSVTGTFLIDKYPVTNCEFTQLMWDSIPTKISYNNKQIKDDQEDWIHRKKNSLRNENCAVHDSAANRIFLYQAIKYANARSIREGLKPYYVFSETSTYGTKILSKGHYNIPYYSFSSQENEYIHVSVDESSDGYRLPYYDEWMMLARGGDKKNKAPWGDSSASIEEVAKYARFGTTKSLKSEPVGQLLPNGYGLYDMFGLVEEHVLFNERNPFNGLYGSASSLKGGNNRIVLNNPEKKNSSSEATLTIGGVTYKFGHEESTDHDNWKKINYGYNNPNYSGTIQAGFRLIRNIGNNAKWKEIKTDD